MNREVLDGARFAEHVDSVRKEPLVAERTGQAITGRLLAADPDLVAVRPLLESAATSLVGSPTFGPVVRLAAGQAHQAMTNDDPTQIVLRLADLGVVLAGCCGRWHRTRRRRSRPTSTSPWPTSARGRRPRTRSG